MTRDELRAWMTEHRYSVRVLAATLGVSQSTVQRWRDGTRGVPPYLDRALSTLERGES